MRQKLLFIFLTAFALLSTSCSDDSVDPEITLNDTQIMAPAEGLTKSITFNSAKEWHAECPSWMKLNPANGEGGDVRMDVTISATQEKEARKGEIKLISDDLVKTIEVTQAQKDALVAAPGEITVGSEGETINFKVGHNVDFKVDVQAEWIKQVATKAYQEDIVKFEVAPNTEKEERTAKIIFTSTDGKLQQEVAITQAQLDAFVISTSEIEVDAKGKRITLKVGTNIDFEVKIDCDWILQKGSRAYEEKNLYFEVKPNSSEEARSAKINFVASNSELSQTVTINQKGIEIFNIEQLEYQVAKTQQEITVKVEYNMPYTFKINCDWIHEAATATAETKEHKFTVDANTEPDKRTGTITFTTDDKSQSLTVKVIQEEGDVELFEWIDIPAGSFIMGRNDGDENERPAHKVTLTKGFKMSKYLVTYDIYDKFCNATGREKPSDAGWGRGKRPVIRITWEDAQAFCDWAEVRLPTEAEWEYACRAGTTTKYSFGDKPDDAYIWHLYNADWKTQHVGQKLPNPWGLYDMHGNVWEWCSDWMGPYTGEDQVDPIGVSKEEALPRFKVFRGGSIFDAAAKATSTARDGNYINYDQFTNVSFRVVKDLD